MTVLEKVPNRGSGHVGAEVPATLSTQLIPGGPGQSGGGRVPARLNLPGGAAQRGTPAAGNRGDLVPSRAP